MIVVPYIGLDDAPAPNELAVRWRQRRKRVVDDHPDRTQRMIGPYPRFQIDIAKKRPRLLIGPAHPSLL
jgi:hypothetical protein